MAYEDLAEFFFAAHPAVVQLQTIEITHPNFTTPFRFVRNDPNGIRAFVEGDLGPFVFQYLPMEIKTLGTSSSLDQAMEITLGDLGTIIPTQLQIISDENGFQTKPVIVYREYRSDEYAMQATDGADWTFDGVNDVISYGDVNDIERTDSVTISAWINTSSLSSAQVIASKLAPPPTLRGWDFGVETNGALFFLLISDTTTSNEINIQTFGATIPINTLLHVAVVYTGTSDDTGVTFYINGVVSTKFTPHFDDGPITTTTVNTAAMNVGAGFEGELTHVSIFTAALTGAQILEVYNGGTPPDLNVLPTAPPPVLWSGINTDDATGPDGVNDYGSGGTPGTAGGGLGEFTSDIVPIYLEPMFGPFTMQINSIAFNKSGCTFTAKPKAFNRARTGEIYDIGRFPMLVGFV